MSQNAKVYALNVHNHADLDFKILEEIIAEYIMANDKWSDIVKYVRKESSNVGISDFVEYVIMLNRFLTYEEAEDLVSAFPESNYTTITTVIL